MKQVHNSDEALTIRTKGYANPSSDIKTTSDVDRGVGRIGFVWDQIRPYVDIARVDHWFKNVFMVGGVLLAYFCYPEAFHVQLIWQFLLGLASVCLLASSNYVINEILDAPTDRVHPTKCRRPIPAGKVRVWLAVAQWILLGTAGLFLARALSWPFFFAALSLLIMGMIYNVPPIRTKEHPYVDVVTESVNNPIRLLLGWFIIVPAILPPVSLLVSYWMIGAFFMAAKRFAEYRTIDNAAQAGTYRKSFRHYNEQKLLISMFFYVTCFALFLGVFIIRYHLELILIVPLLAGFICYYLHVSFKKDSCVQNPEKLYKEKGLMAFLFVCMIAFFLLMFVHIPALYDYFNVRSSPMPSLWQF